MIKEPIISQNFKYGESWKTLSLTENEIEVLRESHRDHTLAVMKQSIKDVAKELTEIKDITPIACALFEARAEKLFTWVQRALQDKTRSARANGGQAVDQEWVRATPSSGGD